MQLACIWWFSPGRGLPLDDAWIHQVVARTFAETGTLGYAPGHHGAAATSYLWAALLGINFKVLHLEPSRWALILNAISALAAGQLLFSILLRARARLGVAGDLSWTLTSLVASGMTLCSPNVLWFVCSGMEAMPFVALSLATIWAASSGVRSEPAVSADANETTSTSAATSPPSPPTPPAGRLIACGVFAGLLAWLRPEATPLGGLLVAHALFRLRDVRRATWLGAPWLAAVALYVVSNVAKTGHMLPSTLSGRRWLWFEMSAGLSRVDRAFDYLDQWGTRLGSYTFDTSLAVVWILVALAGYGAFRLCRAPIAKSAAQAAPRRSAHDDGILMLVGWALFHASFYGLLLPTSGHGGRYQPFTPILFAALLPIGTAFALRELARILTSREDIRFGWFAVVSFAPWLLLMQPVEVALRDANALAVAHIQATEVDTGTFVATLPPNAAIASFDIGGIGYSAKNRRILDLGGLSDPSVAALLESGRVSTWLESNDVRYIVLPAPYERVLPTFEDYTVRLHFRDNPALKLRAIRVFETPFEKWEPAIRATWNAAPKQIVYEVTYTKAIDPADPSTTPEAPLVGPTALREVNDAAGLVPRRERIVAEHMLAVLEAHKMLVDVRVVSESEAPTSMSASAAASAPAPAPTFDLASGGVINKAAAAGPCGVKLGYWGVAFDDACSSIADGRLLKALAYEHVGRYLDVGDLGGALRAVPHVLVQARRISESTTAHPSSRDAFFDPLIAPLAPPIPGGIELKTMRAGAWGLVLAFGVFVALVGVGVAAARDAVRASRLIAFLRSSVRARTASPAIVLVLSVVVSAVAPSTTGCRPNDADVTHAVPRGRGAVEIALANGGSPNEVPGTHLVPLLAAATSGDVDVLTLLLERGASLDVRAADGASPLHIATRFGHVAAVTVLANAIAHGTRAALPQGTSNKDREAAVAASLATPAGPRARSALHDAVAIGSIDCVAALIAAGAKADVVDSFGQSPLHLVANVERARSVQLAQLLLGASANARLPDARGFSALHAAAVSDNAELVRILVNSRTVGLDDRSTRGETALDVATRYGQDRAADVLVRAGSTFTNPEAWPPLHDAARMDAAVRIANLIASGSPVERSVRGKTALDLAKENGSTRAIVLLTKASSRDHDEPHL